MSDEKLASGASRPAPITECPQCGGWHAGASVSPEPTGILIYPICAECTSTSGTLTTQYRGPGVCGGCGKPVPSPEPTAATAFVQACICPSNDRVPECPFHGEPRVTTLTTNATPGEFVCVFGAEPSRETQAPPTPLEASYRTNYEHCLAREARLLHLVSEWTVVLGLDESATYDAIDAKIRALAGGATTPRTPEPPSLQTILGRSFLVDGQIRRVADVRIEGRTFVGVFE